MEKPTYSLRESPDGYWYEFDSISDTKIIRKAVGYYESNFDANVVELAFGDLIDNKLNVTVVSDNKDFLKIINTVIVTIYRFLELYPQKTVSFMGSSQSRNRIYRAIIAKIYDENSSDFDIFGITYDSEIEKFIPNKDYFAFQIQRKS